MVPHPLAGHAVTRDEYDSLVRDGVLHEDDHVELLRGIIVEMTPQGVAHAHAIRELTRHFVLAAGGAFEVLVQLPLSLGEDSEPEPDLALVTPGEVQRPDGHPRTAVLVVEVAGESLRADRTVKAAIYAGAAIDEYWIVNLDERCVEVHRGPDRQATRYAAVCRVGVTDSLAPAALPGAALPVARLFRESGAPRGTTTP